LLSIIKSSTHNRGTSARSRGLPHRSYLAAENRILRAYLPADCGCPIRRDPHSPRSASNSVPGGLPSQARHHSGLVPEANCPQVRRSKHRRYLGRPPMDARVEALIHPWPGECWLGAPSDRGALRNLGDHISGQTVGNILKRHGITPAPKRS
jgi:hypothetical protein